MPYTVREETFFTLEDEWRRLLPHSAANTVFLTPDWAKVWWQHFGDTGMLLLAIRDGSRLVGIAPLLRRGDVISFLGDPGICDYLDFIVLEGEEPAVFQAVLDYLAPLSWQSLDLHGISSNSPTREAFTQIARSRGYSVDVSLDDVCPLLDLPSNWDDYLALLSKKDRHELKRKKRRLAQTPSRCYVIEDQTSLAEDMEDFLRLHRLSREDKARFMTPEMSRFFRAVSASLMARGHLKLFFLEIAGARASTALCFDYGDTLLLYNSGYDPNCAPLSVGLLLKAYCIEQAIAWKKNRFDFLRGAEPYKYDLGGIDRQVFRVVARRED